MDQAGTRALSLLQKQIDALVEAVNDDDLLAVLAGLRSFEGEQLDYTHSATTFTPLQSAVLEQHHLRKLIVHLLLAKGAGCKAGEQSPIELTRQVGNEEMFELLQKWDRGEREGELVDLARYLLGLNDEEAAAWQEQTIAEEEQRPDSDALEDLHSDPSRCVRPPQATIGSTTTEYAHGVLADDRAVSSFASTSTLLPPPPFVNRAPRSSYFVDLPPISILHLHASTNPVYTTALRLDDLPCSLTRTEMSYHVCSVIPPSCIDKLTLKDSKPGLKCCLIYLKARLEVSGILTSFTFSAVKHGRTPRAVVATPTLYIWGWPQQIRQEGVAACLLGLGLTVTRLSDVHCKPSSTPFCFASFKSVAEAEDAMKNLDGASLWEGQKLRAHWSDSDVKESYDADLLRSNPRFLEAADFATFTCRVSHLGWRSALEGYISGQHSHLPALEMREHLLPPIGFSPPQLSEASRSDSNAPRQLSAPNAFPLGPPRQTPAPPPPPPSPPLTLFLGLLKSDYSIILTTLCEGFLRRRLCATPQPSSSEATIVDVEVESQRERQLLVQSLSEMEFGGKRIVIGFTRQEVDQGLAIASGTFNSSRARYPTPDTPRRSWSSS